jgi:hypothetical protein
LIPLKINQTDPSGVCLNAIVSTNFTGNISQASGYSNTFQTYSFPSVTCSGKINTSTINTATISNSEINALAGINTSSTIESRLSFLYSTLTTATSNISILDGSFYTINASVTNLWNTLTGVTYSSSTDTTTIYNNLSVSGTLQGLNTTIYSSLSGITSNVQSQLNSLQGQSSSNSSSISSLSYNTSGITY